MEFALNNGNGCLAQIDFCRETNMTSEIDKAVCAEAEDMCRDNVEGVFTIPNSQYNHFLHQTKVPFAGPYYVYSGRGTYDIRVSASDPVPPVSPMETYLNQGFVQDALGVNLNYTPANNEVYYAFQQAGDIVYPTALLALEDLLEKGVRVALYAGDADYICNWFGGEAVSLTVNYTHAEQFRNSGYAPFEIDGAEYGEVRQYGNFSFLRIYESGHQVPYFQRM
jgi:carboxypeptidase C (cathepsin A)